MISETAISSLEELIAQGLQPTPRDVIRLNAIGLRLEAASSKRVQDSTYLLPRVAQLSKTLWLRQPAIGHEIWLEKVQRFIDPDDYKSSIAVQAFALSRDVADLPDPDSPTAIKTAVDTFTATCANCTRDQIIAALRYATIGCDPTACEHPAYPDGRTQSDQTTPGYQDWTECVAVGVLNEGRAVLWGITEADMRRMTTQQLSDVIERAKIYHKMATNSEEDIWQGRYYATLDEITERLKKEQVKPNG